MRDGDRYLELGECERNPRKWMIYFWVFSYCWWEVINLGGPLWTGRSSAAQTEAALLLPAAEVNLPWKWADIIMNPQHGKEVKWEALILILNLFMILKEDWDVESRALFPAFIQICQFVPSLDLKKKINHHGNSKKLAMFDRLTKKKEILIINLWRFFWWLSGVVLIFWLVLQRRSGVLLIQGEHYSPFSKMEDATSKNKLTNNCSRNPTI